MKRRSGLLIVLVCAVLAVLLAGCDSATYVARQGDNVQPVGGPLWFGGPLLSTITVWVTPAGLTIDLGDGHSLVFGPNAVAENTQVRITRIGSAGANSWWTMFSPQFEIDILSGGRAGGGVVNLILNIASVNLGTHNQWMSGIYHWTPFKGQIQIANGPARTAGDLGRWKIIRPYETGSTVTDNIEGLLDLTQPTSVDSAGTGGMSNVIPTGPTFAGVAPAQRCFSDRVPQSWFQQPTAPQGYRYVGMTVVLNKVCIETTYDLHRDDRPTDLVMINSSTTVENGVTTEDVIVGHVFEPIAQD